jgi:hypothetical protein
MKIDGDSIRLYWAATSSLLVAGLAGQTWAVVAAPMLTTVQCIHFCARGYTIDGLPLQVRLAYLAMLVAGFWPPLAFLHVVQCVGVTANVFFDYCLLARLLSLAPCHRRGRLTLAAAWWTLTVPPAPGSILARRRPALP